MKRKFILIILCFLLLPSVLAWRWETHQNLAEKAYSSFLLELQGNLNLTLIRDGSIAPDKVFHDNRLHHYPPSLELTEKWFKIARESYNKKDYNNASYAFGVMSHYITDSFAAPHYIAKEPYKLHSEFERQVTYYIPKTKCQKSNYDLNQSLFEGSKNYYDWEPWLLSKDKLIPQSETEEAIKLLYTVSLDLFDTNCAKLTDVIKEKINFNATFIIAAIVIIILIAVLVFILILDLFKD